MLRQVRGPGTLVPREIRWIAAQSAGRVERVIVRPGAVVEPDTILAEMSNPDLMRQAEEARYELEAAKAELTELELNLRSQELDQRAAVASASAAYEGARLQAEAERTAGVVAELTVRRSELLAEQLKASFDIEVERLDQFGARWPRSSSRAARASLRIRTRTTARASKSRRCHVRAGLGGVVQQVMIEGGEQVQPGANVARVARPDELQAELRVPETQARDVLIGQLVDVDTRNGIVAGKVIRIDPSVHRGHGAGRRRAHRASCRAARGPICRSTARSRSNGWPNAVHTGRPAYGQPNSTITLVQARRAGRVRRSGARRARPHVGQCRRDRARFGARRRGDPLRHFGVGRQRPHSVELTMLANLLNDVRYCLRGFARRPCSRSWSC